MNSPRDVLPVVVDRIRDSRHIIGAVAAGLVTTAAIVVLFLVQAHIYQQAIASRDDEVNRLAVNYAKLRDQDFALRISPAAPSLAEVENPGSGNVKIPLPRAFTAAFPDGYFTCTDRTGAGDYACTISHTPRATSTTTGPGR